MSADKTKAMNGPFNADFQKEDPDNPGTYITILTTPIEGRENDRAEVKTEPIEEEAGDGRMDVYGERAISNITIPEIDSTMKSEIEGETAERVVITFLAKSMKWTITGLKRLRVDVEDKQSKIQVIGEKYDGTDPWTYTSTT